jgi:predicted membrane-bound spermidine synthase
LPVPISACLGSEYCRAVNATSRLVILAIFFVSGAAALLYQVVWQRALFAIVGINFESVTIVVTAFMLGLGVGSLAGGALSRRLGSRVLLVFAAFEAGIGLFGLLSLRLFRSLGELTLSLSYPGTFALTLLMVLVPTALMGATLPLLVAWFVRATGNVGRSVGVLYFINTLGSAAASFAGVLYLLAHLGQSGTVRVAALMNAVAAVAIAIEHLRAARSRA